MFQFLSPYYSLWYSTLAILFLIYYIFSKFKIFYCKGDKKNYIYTMTPDNNVSENDKYIHDLFTAQEPTVVFITGENCGPCKQMKPVFLKMTQLFEGEVKFHFIDAHSHIDIVRANGVRKIPYTMLIKDGAIQHRILGPAPESGLSSAIKGHLLREGHNYDKLDFEL